MRVAIIDDEITSKMILNNKVEKYYISDKYILKELTRISDNVFDGEDTHADICSKIIRKYSPDCDIVNLIIKNPNEIGDYYKLEMALKYALLLNIDIINMSVGITKKLFAIKMFPLVERLKHNNIIVIAAYSNLGKVTYPASFKSVIGCKAAIDAVDPYFKNKVCYASGSHIIRTNAGKLFITPNANSYAAAYMSSLVSNNMFKL